MACVLRPALSSRFLILPLLFALLWPAAPSRAEADVITADYSPFSIMVPDTEDGERATSPYYDCEGGQGFLDTRLCHYLWQNGLELFAPGGGLYADGYFLLLDSGGGSMELRPRCEADIAPCFTTFTPLLFALDTGGNGAFTPFFVSSSRGGYMEFLATSDTPRYAIPFSGDEWTDLAWLQVGFYEPSDCANREDLGFQCRWDVALSNLALTFEADTQTVPEPLGLLPFGVALWAVRRRRAFRQGSAHSARTWPRW